MHVTSLAQSSGLRYTQFIPGLTLPRRFCRPGKKKSPICCLPLSGPGFSVSYSCAATRSSWRRRRRRKHLLGHRQAIGLVVNEVTVGRYTDPVSLPRHALTVCQGARGFLLSFLVFYFLTPALALTNNLGAPHVKDFLRVRPSVRPSVSILHGQPTIAHCCIIIIIISGSSMGSWSFFFSCVSFPPLHELHVDP